MHMIVKASCAPLHTYTCTYARIQIHSASPTLNTSLVQLPNGDTRAGWGQTVRATQPAVPLGPRCVLLGQEHTLSVPGSSSAVRPEVQPLGSRSATPPPPPAVMPWTLGDTRGRGSRAGRPRPQAHAVLRLTASVLVLAAGAVQDPVAPVRGADAGPRGAALDPGHQALVLHLQGQGRESSQQGAPGKPHAPPADTGAPPALGAPAAGERRFPLYLSKGRWVLATIIHQREQGWPSAAGGGGMVHHIWGLGGAPSLGLGQHSDLPQVTSGVRKCQSTLPRADGRGQAVVNELVQEGSRQRCTELWGTGGPGGA